VAQTATIYNFAIDLADNDRQRYESLALRVARHPSESDDYLVARVLAYCLEYAEGITFSRGLSDPDEPAIAIRDMTGAWQAWIEVGTPDAARLHKAGKAARRVAVYCHKDPGQWLRQLEGERIHRADALTIASFDRPFITALTAGLERRIAFTFSVAGGDLLVATESAVIEGRLTRHVLPT
jgi:uncharacterized protein YaeQ